MDNHKAAYSLRDIIRDECICTHFQPIISLKTGTIFAYEALVRGYCDSMESLIYPCELFEKALEEQVSVEFDRLCRQKALERYSGFQNGSTSMIFININTSEVGVCLRENQPHISLVTRQMGFDPRHVGLELLESKALSSEDLIDFVHHYRKSGFLIVVDDFGCEHSNLDRLIQIHPDIIKIDRNIISGIQDDAYRQSILKSIRSLAEMTGALCLAEGVETIEELKTCHLLGVDLFQGFIIARPHENIEKLDALTKQRITELQTEIRPVALASLKQRRRLTGDINQLADWLMRQISRSDIATMESVFQEFIAMNDEIECIYVLDEGGIQISATVCSSALQRSARPTFYHPAGKGANHSFKNYVTCFEALGIKRYLTDIYLSLASGNLCRTFSVRIEDSPQQTRILCIDFLEERLRHTLSPAG